MRPILSTRTLRLRKVKRFPWEHTAGRRQSRNHTFFRPHGVTSYPPPPLTLPLQGPSPACRVSSLTYHQAHKKTPASCFSPSESQGEPRPSMPSLSSTEGTENGRRGLCLQVLRKMQPVSLGVVDPVVSPTIRKRLRSRGLRGIEADALMSPIVLSPTLLPTHIFVHLSTHPSIYLPVYPFILGQPTHPHIHSSTHPPINLSTYPEPGPRKQLIPRAQLNCCIPLNG